MKKTFTIFICFVLVFALVSCGNSDPVETNGNQNGEIYEENGENQNGYPENGENLGQDTNGDSYEENGEIENGDPENGADPNGENQNGEEQNGNNDTQDNSEVNAGEALVEITLTAWLVGFLLEFVGMTPDQLLNDREFETTRFNQDGSFTGTLPRAEHEAIMAELRGNLPGTFNDLVGNPMMPHVRSVTGTDDFRNVTVEVDRLAYENSGFELAHIVIGMAVLVYQMFGGQEGHVTMHFRDVDNGNLLSTYIFPN